MDGAEERRTIRPRPPSRKTQGEIIMDKDREEKLRDLCIFANMHHATTDKLLV